MQKHPDADAFMRKYLAQPTDATARLVFADWLEETGEAHNTAWAHYIRLKIEADRYPFDSRERRHLDRKADAYAPRIRANLTIPAALFVGYPKSLLQLLPAPNITVKLAGYSPDPGLRRTFVRDMLVLCRMVPLAQQGDTVLIAIENPHDSQPAIAHLSNLFALNFVAVRASGDEILATLSRHFPPPIGDYTGIVSSALY